MTFRLNAVDIRWTGRDDATPDGCVNALGVDQAGNVRMWLFTGDQVADDTCLGSILIPGAGSAQLPDLYGPGGAWVGVVTGYADAQQRLVQRADTPQV